MADLKAISLKWERETGNDSIATIERVYDRTPAGAYKCVWPNCKVARYDSAVLWRHVHTAHGTWSLPPQFRGRELRPRPTNLAGAQPPPSIPSQENA